MKTPVLIDETRLAPPWARIVEVIHLMFILFGRPADLAARGVIGPRQRAQMRDFLRVVENLVRHALFLDAAALAPSPARPARVRVRTKAGARGQFGEEPALWACAFRLAPRPGRGGGGGRRWRPAPRYGDPEPRYELPPWTRPPQTRIGAAASAPANAQNTVPVYEPDGSLRWAKRFEALLRVVRAPQRRLAGLARRLHGSGGRAFAARMLAPAPRSLFDRHGDELKTLGPACAALVARYPDSS